MTGESIGQREISDDQSLLNNLVERYFKQEELPETFIGNNITNKSNLDDEDVINIMLKSKQKIKSVTYCRAIMSLISIVRVKLFRVCCTI